ncbi:MAG: hypothetical protein OJF49_001631 [Ktedonobacterales bacterium]|jgi:hypothetical protein|nr:MAG: hypothetical protein OJF49_001631 [Ktedonobacterales bacterium]
MGGMSASRIFISHSHADNNFARKLADELRAAGADVWYDEHNLSSGDFLNNISRELRDRSVVVVVLSKSALASQWVNTDLDSALALHLREPGRIIVPIVAEPLAPETLPPLLASFKRIAAPGDQPYSPEEAARHLLDTLGLKPLASTASTIAEEAEDAEMDEEDHSWQVAMASTATLMLDHLLDQAKEQIEHGDVRDLAELL